LSSLNSTQLTAPLYTTSTEIQVENSSVLPTPNLLKQIPGVVLINGERIEYLTITGNILRNLKRATLGTAARDYYPAGTTLIDQGRFQTIPFKENITRDVFEVGSDTTITSWDLVNIQLSTSTNQYGLTDFDQQVEVYYGGRLLRKSTTSTNVLTIHDSRVSFDSGETNSSNISSDVVLQPEFTITTNTNAGYTLHLALSELSTSTTATTVTVGLTTGTRIVVVQTTATVWYNGDDSLVTNNSIQANFLRDKPATLPDKYHYGQL
jgi:hypothetical protein